MTATCRVVAQRLPLAGPDGGLGGRLDDHVGKCLTCQAETARYRKLHRALSWLATELETAPASLAAAVEIAIDRAERTYGDSDGRRLGRVAAATGAVAAAAGVVAVALWRRTHHAA